MFFLLIHCFLFNLRPCVRVWRCLQVCAWVLNTTKNNNQGALQLTCLCDWETKLISQTATTTKYKVHKRSSFNSFQVCVSVPVCAYVCVCACLSAARRLPFWLLLLYSPPYAGGAVISLAPIDNHCHLKMPPTQLCFEIKVYSHTHTVISTHMHAHSCGPHPTVIRGKAKVNVMREHAKGHKYKHSEDCVFVCAINHFIVYKSFN